MARYTVHVPPPGPGDAGALARAVFVRDGWSWGAFLFGPLWLLWHRHWVAGLLLLPLHMLALGGLGALALAPLAGAVAHALLALLYGLEGSSLRRLALARRGFAEVAVVIGAAQDEIEHRFFAAARASTAPPLPLPVTSVPTAGRAAVIGLFPEARTP